MWQTIQDLKQYVYRSAHAKVQRRRQEWFERFDGPYPALWWIPEDHTPSVDEAKQRLAHLAANGPSPFAFTLKVTHPSDEVLIEATDWSAFEPCPTPDAGTTLMYTPQIGVEALLSVGLCGTGDGLYASNQV